jgi:hypothetical protein
MTTITQTPAEAPTSVFPMSPRGPLSSRIMQILEEPPAQMPADIDLSHVVQEAVDAAGPASIVRDDDIQLSLFVLYSLHYGSFADVDDDWEWQPFLISARGTLERAFEDELRATVAVPQTPEPRRSVVAATLAELTAIETGPSLSRFVSKSATREQLAEFLIQRSVYTLREADPHSWAIPRLTGRSKVALVEIQADEYGGGRHERMHSEIFARTMRGVGLDSTYGRYVENVPAITLASLNLMSMFGLNRRLRGAIAGHLAAFEMTSSIPNLMYGNGFRRLGYDASVTAYFDEHVAADAVHEQIAAYDLAGALAEDDPRLVGDIVFGASACLAVDGWAAAHMYDTWTNGGTSLRRPVA